jgi:lipooligosaccharide transport system permease protein
VTPDPGRLDHPALRWLPVWQRNLLVWVKLLGPALLGNFGEPLLYLLALGYGLGGLVGNVAGLPYPVFLTSGIVCSSAMLTASFEGMYSAYTRMDVQKTWDAMLAAPLSVRDVVLGETVWAGTKSLVSVAAILAVAAVLGTAKGWATLLVLPVVLLTGICFGALALIVTAFARGYDFFLYYNTLLITPMMLFSGVFFPLEGMPEALQWAARMMPLSQAVEIVRPLMTGRPIEAPLLHLGVLCLYSGVGVWLATRLITRRLQR